MQFHWRNAGHADFDAFLASMSHDKRKKIRQDRKKVAAAGLRHRWLRGDAIGADELDFFYQCYRATYFQHGNPPYLSADFFHRARDQPDAFVLILAERDGARGGGAEPGRRRRAVRTLLGCHGIRAGPAFRDLLHAGHRLLHRARLRPLRRRRARRTRWRAACPTPTWSAHWVADPRFADAIQRFLDEETTAVEGYLDELEAHTPFAEHAR